jgi:hypothetical protein
VCQAPEGGLLMTQQGLQWAVALVAGGLGATNLRAERPMLKVKC